MYHPLVYDQIEFIVLRWTEDCGRGIREALRTMRPDDAPAIGLRIEAETRGIVRASMLDVSLLRAVVWFGREGELAPVGAR
jgi:hypothetical protein